MRHPELLLPAGSLPVLKTAFHYGADAVYLGHERYGLREKAHNFTWEEMAEGIDYAHARRKKVYVTANIFAHNEDIDGAEEYFLHLRELSPDGILISDPGMFALAGRICPEIPRHISTQANCTNYASCRWWAELGAKRIVLARELSLPEIRRIREELPEETELEAFVHGAMCMAYSGRCLLSSYLAGRDANRGSCSHPCRWEYALQEETRPGRYFPVEEDERGTYFLSSGDLCMAEHLPDLYAAGIDSFKIEGRMKTALYAAVCARTYALAMRDYEQDPGLYESRKGEYRRQISACTFRPFMTGFYYGRPEDGPKDKDAPAYEQNDVFMGIIEGTDAEGRIVFRQKNKFSTGDVLEIMKPDGRDISFVVKEILRDDGSRADSAPHPAERLHVTAARVTEEAAVSADSPDGILAAGGDRPADRCLTAEPGDILRKKKV